MGTDKLMARERSNHRGRSRAKEDIMESGMATVPEARERRIDTRVVMLALLHGGQLLITLASHQPAALYSTCAD